MALVVRFPKLVAWASEPTQLEPGWKDVAVSVSAILCPPDLELTRDDHLYFLGERIQRLINRCEDPREAAENLRQDLFEAGLYRDESRVPAAEAGNRLIWSNTLGVGYRLSQWGLLPTRSSRTCEMRAAREEISADQDCPEDRLRSWAGLLSRLP